MVCSLVGGTMAGIWGLVVVLAIFLPSIKSSIKEDIQTALNLGNSSIEYNREECVWRSPNEADTCHDTDMRFILYSNIDDKKRQIVDLKQSDWLRHSAWDPNLSNVILIHGYAGGDSTFPMSMLRDAYVSNGSFNVFFVDWGSLARLPCYPAAVHNMRLAAKCAAGLLTFLKDANPQASTTCVGHSLGAHFCGLIGQYLTFRINRIIGLDPAKPLIRTAMRLRQGTADSVQVIHTNAGTYGEAGKLGKVDFCLNGGKTQPRCENATVGADLCSHVLSVCYMAASLDMRTASKAYPCSRRCPSGPRPTHRLGAPVPIGQHTPDSASGTYCVASKELPYCPQREGDPGHLWCCLDERAQQQTLETPPPLENSAVEVEDDRNNEFERKYNFFKGTPKIIYVR